MTDNVETAVNEIVGYYRVYHSARYVRDQLVIRLTRRLPDAYVALLAAEFADIVTDGGMQQRGAFAVERDDPPTVDLPRLVLGFDRLHFGRLRQLIDRINAAPEA